MLPKTIRIMALMALVALLALLPAFNPTQVDAQPEAVQQTSKRTTVAKVKIAIQRNGGFVTLSSGGGLDTETTLRPNQKRVVFKVRSKTVTAIDQINLTYNCKDPGGDPDKTRQKSRFKGGEANGVTLPATIALNLPADSENCFVAASVSAPWSGSRAGKITASLVTR